MTPGFRLQEKVHEDSNIIYPLNEFYEQLGLPQPMAAPMEARDIPEPYRSLLVHDRDMTPTLEYAHDQPVRLRVLQYAVTGNVLSRQVVLVPESDGQPAAFGAIKIHLEHFHGEARRLVLERKIPLGTILRTEGMEHAGHPDAYIRITPDALIQSALGLQEPVVLYGRRNSLVDGRGQTLAQVVEVLAPRNGTSRPERNRA
jgi:chorismate-pyruvate lyase